MTDMTTKTTRELLTNRTRLSRSVMDCCSGADRNREAEERLDCIASAIARDERQTAEIKSLQDKIIECATVYAKHRTDDANAIAAAELAGDALESINREKQAEIERLTTAYKSHAERLTNLVDGISADNKKLVDRCLVLTTDRLTKIIAAVREYCQGYSGINNNMNDVEWGSAKVADSVLNINQETTR